MFCRFGIAAAQPPGRRDGLVEARVDASRRRVHELRQRVDVGALQLLHRRATRARASAASCDSASSSSTATAVDAGFRLARLLADRQLAASRTGCPPSCFGELILNDSPARSKIRAVTPAISVSRCRDNDPRAPQSTLTPACSMAIRTGTNGISRTGTRRQVRVRPIPGQAGPPTEARGRPVRTRSRARRRGHVRDGDGLGALAQSTSSSLTAL